MVNGGGGGYFLLIAIFIGCWVWGNMLLVLRANMDLSVWKTTNLMISLDVKGNASRDEYFV
jgi:hypothetical protein